jgi:hypothetical protein
LFHLLVLELVDVVTANFALSAGGHPFLQFSGTLRCALHIAVIRFEPLGLSAVNRIPSTPPLLFCTPIGLQSLGALA